MKLENKEFGFDNFVSEMTKLKNEKHFDYLVTIVGEDFGEEGLGVSEELNPQKIIHRHARTCECQADCQTDWR